MTLAEKILAAHSGKKEVSPGEFINVRVDLVLANDIIAPLAIREFQRLGVRKVSNPERVVMVPDHFCPNKDILSAEQAKEVWEFAKEYKLVIGGCTNGRLDDLRIAARILKNRSVHPEVGCIIIPGSQGEVYKYGANIDTDAIVPARYLNLSEPKELAKHCMEGIDPHFASRVKPGDIIVAATNFGCGSEN